MNGSSKSLCLGRKLGPKGIVSKNILLRACLYLYWANGYHATSVDDVVKLADKNKASFYQYFDTKNESLVECIDYIITSSIQKLHSLAEDKSGTFSNKLRNYANHCNIAKNTCTPPNMDKCFGSFLLNIIPELDASFCDSVRNRISEFLKSESLTFINMHLSTDFLVGDSSFYSMLFSNFYIKSKLKSDKDLSEIHELNRLILKTSLGRSARPQLKSD